MWHLFSCGALVVLTNTYIMLLCRLQLGDVNWMIEVRLTKATLFRHQFGKQHKVSATIYFQ